MKIHIVHRTVDGYAREDARETSIIGAYTNDVSAHRVATVTTGKITTLEVDVIPPGIAESIDTLFAPVARNHARKD